jgi:drug/metabolite transporter (DMT)-like permease
MLPLLRGSGRQFARLNARDILALLFIAVGGSVVATSIFTYGIKYGNPSVVVLLQKTQPVFAVLLARLFLGEKPKKWFWLCLSPALFGAYFVSIPDWRSGFALDPRRPLSIVAALGASLLWGSSTVFGRYILGRVPVLTLTGLRFLTALPVLAVLYFLQAPMGRLLPTTPHSIGRLLAMAFFPGLLGLISYYRGLQTTRASVASVAELVFPLTAVVVNWIALGISLSRTQVFGAATLVASITALAYLNARRSDIEDMHRPGKYSD